MPATAENLRDLHLLHQRAQALRDRLSSGPKTLAARQAALAARQAELETARKALQDTKVQRQEARALAPGHRDQDRRPQGQAQPGQEERRVQGPPEPDRPRQHRQGEARGGHPLGARGRSRPRRPRWRKLEADVKRSAAEVAALQQQIDEQSAAHKAQLRELETAIIEAETAIPEEHRDHYRRIVAPIRRRRPGRLRGRLLPRLLSPRSPPR